MKLKILDRKPCHKGFFSLDKITLKHELFAGGMSETIEREVLNMRRAVAVLLYDPVLDQLVMIEQFRIGAIGHPQGAWVLELVAGLVEEGENDREVAVREALEESGCEITDLELIHEYMVAPAATTERLVVFCARVDASKAEGIHGVVSEGEDIKVHVISADQAFAEADGGRINTACPIIAMQWFKGNRHRLQTQWLLKPL